MDKVHLYKDLYFELPPQPKKQDIQGWGLHIKDQKWKRTELPENWDELTQEEQEKFAFEEDRKCNEGVWFMCKGVPTYISGDHYFYLNWFHIDSGYPDYRDRDRRWFYHVYLCFADEECLGQDYGKLRRDGYSYRCDSIILNRARKTFNAKYGIISKTSDDAKEMFNKLVNGFINLPDFFKPQVATAEDIKNDLWLKTPQQKVTFKNRVIKKEISLNTLISHKATKENSFDGWKLQVLCADESGKFPKDVSIEKWFNIGKTCLILGSKIIGKMLMGSTVNEAEKGGEGFKNIWDNSDHTKKSENGRTISGLWRYFVSAVDGMEGFIDEYGQSVIDTPETPVMGIDGRLIKKGARDWLLAELKAKKDANDMVGYYELKRQFPITEDDMFITPSQENPEFDIEKIYQQIEHNDIHVVENTLHYGYFQWIGGIRNGAVEWIETPRTSPMAKFTFTWFPPEQDRNKWIMGRDGFKAPANTHKGLFTLDPYAAVSTIDTKRGSKAASHGIKKYDIMHPIKHKHFISEYWNRLKDPLIVYEDMVMCCHYFGWGLLPERNVRNCNDYFRNRDLHKYLLPSPSMTNDDFIGKVDKIEDAGVANSGDKTRQQFIEYLASWITNYCGVNEKTGEMGYMPFNNTLKDWLDFDVKAWTKYDLTVSSMLGMVGADAVTEIKKKERKHYNFFPKYDISKGHRYR